jgi:hypothetical protein
MMVRSGVKSCDVMEAIPSLVRILRCKPPPGQASFDSRAIVLGRGLAGGSRLLSQPAGEGSTARGDEGMRGCTLGS